MAHTDRDDERHFWHRHRRSNECTERPASFWSRGLHYQAPQSCDVCLSCPPPWDRMGPLSDSGGSVWRKDCRRYERAKSRNSMQRARSGHTDWDDLTIAYRRGYFW